MDFDDLDDAVGGRPYDLIVFGASGFTGCLAVEHLDYLLSRPDATPHKWAIAGRSKRKLQKIQEKCKSDPGIVVAEDQESLELMAEMTTVVLACAGPYMTVGVAVVEACLAKKTHYVDFSGELVFIQKMIKEHHAQAKEQGTMIIHAAGLMSAVEDIALQKLAQKLGKLTKFRMYQMEAGIGGGGSTFLSGFEGYNHAWPDHLDAMIHPFSLGGERKCGVRDEDYDLQAAEEDTYIPGIWLSSGHSTPLTHRLLRRTCELFEDDIKAGVSPPEIEKPVEYGEDILILSRYATMSKGQAQKNAMFAGSPRNEEDVIKFWNAMKEQISKGQFAPPGCGPIRTAREAGGGYSEFYFVAEGENGETAYSHLHGPDGWEITGMIIALCGLCIIEENYEIGAKERGGIITPGYAMCNSTFVDRIVAHPWAGYKSHKIIWDFKDGKPDAEEVKAHIQRDDEIAGEVFFKSNKGMITGAMELPDLLRD